MTTIKSLNLEDLNTGALSDEEKEKLRSILKRNNLLVDHENSRLSRINTEIKSEKTSLNIKQSEFPKSKCLDCSKEIINFGGCERCQKKICGECCHKFSLNNTMICKICYREILLDAQSVKWFQSKAPKKPVQNVPKSNVETPKPKPIVTSDKKNLVVNTPKNVVKVDETDSVRKSVPKPIQDDSKDDVENIVPTCVTNEERYIQLVNSMDSLSYKLLIENISQKIIEIDNETTNLTKNRVGPKKTFGKTVENQTRDKIVPPSTLSTATVNTSNPLVVERIIVKLIDINKQYTK